MESPDQIDHSGLIANDHDIMWPELPCDLQLPRHA